MKYSLADKWRIAIVGTFVIAQITQEMRKKFSDCAKELGSITPQLANVHYLCAFIDNEHHFKMNKNN